MNAVLTSRLSLMMFLQYFIWACWAVTIANYMGTIDMGESIPWAFSVGPISAIIAPFFLGMVADRFFTSEKVLGVLCIIAGVAMLAMPSFASTSMFLILLLIHTLFYMPTLGLTASLSFHHMTNPEKEFPVVRVFGTIGWIVAGFVVSKVLHADYESTPLYIGGGVAIALGLYSFTLPRTPPPSAGQETSWQQILGVDAIKQMRTSFSLRVFLVCSTLAFISFGVYFTYITRFLGEDGMSLSDPGFLTTVGQMSEIIFMLLIPFLFTRLGVKWMLVMGMVAWFIRFGLFAGASLDGVYWMIFLGILIHGICYDFFFVTGQIYIDKKTTRDVRGQVQGLLILLTQGFGMLLGAQLSGLFVNSVGEGGTLTASGWQLFWSVFAVAALIFAMVFLFLFDDKVDEGGETAGATA